MTHPLLIRAARVEDAAALSELISENAAVTLLPHYTPQQWQVFLRYYQPEAMQTKLRTQTVFCAERADRIVGTVALDGDFVMGFYTRLENLKEGIGRQLMEHLEAHAVSLGLKEIRLAASPVGLAFYYKHGWEKVCDYQPVHFGVSFEETLMLKRLGDAGYPG